MPKAGALDRRITIQRAAVTQNGFGEDQLAWADLATISASREDMSDGERLSASQINATLASRFVVRSSTLTRSVTPKDLISYDGGLWDIHGIKETNKGRMRFLEITAMRQVD